MLRMYDENLYNFYTNGDEIPCTTLSSWMKNNVKLQVVVPTRKRRWYKNKGEYRQVLDKLELYNACFKHR